MKHKLHGMLAKMRQLQKTIAAGPNNDITKEDIDAARNAGVHGVTLIAPASDSRYFYPMLPLVIIGAVRLLERAKLHWLLLILIGFNLYTNHRSIKPKSFIEIERLAAWTKANTPENIIIWSRKPWNFQYLSGRKSVFAPDDFTKYRWVEIDGTLGNNYETVRHWCAGKYRVVHQEGTAYLLRRLK